MPAAATSAAGTMNFRGARRGSSLRAMSQEPICEAIVIGRKARPAWRGV